MGYLMSHLINFFSWRNEQEKESISDEFNYVESSESIFLLVKDPFFQ